MNAKVEITVSNCKECPYLKTGVYIDMITSKDTRVYYCKKDGFGAIVKDFGVIGSLTIPEVPPIHCPILIDMRIIELSKKYKIDILTFKELISNDYGTISKIVKDQPNYI